MTYRCVWVGLTCATVLIWLWQTNLFSEPILVPIHNHKPHEPYNFPVLPLTAPTTRSYSFEITEAQTTDGVRTLVNDAFPGPVVHAIEGDTVEITVVNKSPNPLSLHLHGFEQRGTNFMDGATGITQCPIQPGQNFTYSTNASVAGTYWYHNHYGVQSIKGLYGPIVIQERRKLSYTDESVVLAGDFYSRDPQQLYTEFMEPYIGGHEPQPVSFVVHGSPKPGSKVRVINTSSQLAFSLNIWSEIVEVDGFPVQARVCSSIRIASAQRYAFFQLDQTPLNFELDETGFDVFDLAFKPATFEPIPDIDERLTLVATMELDEYGVMFPLFNNTSPSHGGQNLLAGVLGQGYPHKLKVYGGETVEVTIYNNDDSSHPFHLHGHKFWVMQRGSIHAPFPIKRDTVWVGQDDLVKIRFTTDNPGVWLLHCHNVWHSAAGMQYPFVASPAKLKEQTPPDQWYELCSSRN